MSEEESTKRAEDLIREKGVNLRPDRESQTGRVYSNFVHISGSPWDFTLRFCDAPSGHDIAAYLDPKLSILTLPKSR